ncbi:hypothetical protein [Cupriavidus nantongensis]
MFRAILATGLLLTISNAHALKCQSGKKTLYTDERRCPSGFTISDTYGTGSLSVVGKSEEVKRQEAEYLNQRAAEQNRYQAQIAQAQVRESQQQRSTAYVCSTFAEQARALEAQMRRPNYAQEQERLKREHRSVRDHQYRNGC